MNVGKSTSAKIIAQVTGVAESHPLLIAGGDGITPGTLLVSILKKGSSG